MSGTLLERLIWYVLITQGDFQITPNYRGIDSERDLLVRNMSRDDPLLMELGRYIIVEAKNRLARTNSATVKSFVGTLRAAGCHAGILVSVRGITGTKRRTAAWFTVRKHYHRDNVIVIVLDDSDVRSLASGRVRVRRMLVDKYETIRFDA